MNVLFWLFCIFAIVNGHIKLRPMAEHKVTPLRHHRPISPFTKSTSKFAVAFFEAALSDGNENIVMSPFSAQTALSLLYCGSAGNTTGIMAKALDFENESQLQVANQFHTILAPLQNNPTLSIANAIYVMDGYQIQSNYLAKSKNDFFSTVANIDFCEADDAADTMNNWVANKTHNKITNLISPSSLNEYTRLVLLNAIYCKGSWVTPFPSTGTISEVFHLNLKSTIKVQMMQVTSNFRYGFIEALNSQVIELPYKNSDISMLIILPKNLDGLSQLRIAFKNYPLGLIENQISNKNVYLSLPKFKIESSRNLKSTLSALGLQSIFTSAANFSNLLAAGNEQVKNLKVSQVIQKAHIAVNELGTTAAAATAIEIVGSSATTGSSASSIDFNANHPFIFILKSPTYPLFIGTYVGDK